MHRRRSNAASAQSAVPAQVTVGLREVTPPLPLAVALIGLLLGSAALSLLRPAVLPRRAQHAADAATALLLFAHPVEAALTDRLLRRRGITAGSRLKVRAATAVYGVFAAVPTWRAVRRAVTESARG